MTDTNPPTARDPRGRFQPGQSGNPAGKKPGTLNHATRMRLTLEEGEFDVAARKLVELAKDGNLTAIKVLLAEVNPKPRGRPVALAFEAGATLLERFMAVSMAIATGEITPDEGKTIALVLDLEGRERARNHAAEMALIKNGEKLSEEGVEFAAERLDALFPITRWREDDDENPSPACGEGLGGGDNVAASAPAEQNPLHSTCKSPSNGDAAAAPSLDPTPAGGGGKTEDHLHPASIQARIDALPTPRRRAVARIRAGLA
jgi:hypothetical protein